MPDIDIFSFDVGVKHDLIMFFMRFTQWAMKLSLRHREF